MVTSPVRVRIRLPSTPRWVADVEIAQQLEVLAHVVAPEHGLDGAGAVLEVEEGRASHVPHGHDAAGQRLALGIGGGAGLGLNGFEQGDGGGVVAGAAVAGRVGVNAPFAQALQLRPAAGYVYRGFGLAVGKCGFRACLRTIRHGNGAYSIAMISN